MILIVRSIVAIYRKELQGYFKSPLAYVIAGVFWLLAGLFFFFFLSSVIAEAAELELQSQLGGSLHPLLMSRMRFCKHFCP